MIVLRNKIADVSHPIIHFGCSRKLIYHLSNGYAMNDKIMAYE